MSQHLLQHVSLYVFQHMYVCVQQHVFHLEYTSGETALITTVALLLCAINRV